jgi:nucleoside-diphosphate-sugar epimerase
MRVLVTGASGFIGRPLVSAFVNAGFQVRAASRTATQFPAGAQNVQHADLSGEVDWSSLVEGCDAVVHLAGIAHVGLGIPDALYDRVNHQATRELARAAQAAKVSRFVFVSSIRAQSGPVTSHPLTETDPPRPSEPYGASKLAAEAAVKEAGVPHVILRPVVVYGQQARGNFATLMRVAQLPLPLPFGAFTSKRSLLDRAALIDAIILMLRSPMASETFIVADRAPISFKDMITALRRGLGRSPALVPVPRAIVRLPLRLVGRGDILDRIDEEMIVSPAKLIGAGWKGAVDSAVMLEQVAREIATIALR